MCVGGPAPVVFVYNKKFVFHGSEADKAYLWRIVLKESLAFAKESFIAAICNHVFMVNTNDERLLTD